MKSVTCIAPVNIAVIKYWGKADEKLIIPLNDSLSVTLHTDQLRAKTTISLSEDFTEDEIFLNGKQESISNPRLQICLSEIRKRVLAEHGEVPKGCVKIVSENNFPTAAGLASSAAGYACLVFALSRLYNVSGDISAIARQGSGSACRSVMGGFVRWMTGSDPTGADSVAVQVAPASHWPELHCLILVASAEKKKVASTAGMGLTVKTSDLLQYRAKHSVPERTAAITKAILARDFAAFGEITMRESNQLHAVCQDTYPPIRYMNDVSHAIVETVHQYNTLRGGGEILAAYTFDAGPNACVYLLEEEVAPFLAAVKHVFPPEETEGWVTGKKVDIPELDRSLDSLEPRHPGGVVSVIHTMVGDGPSVVESD